MAGVFISYRREDAPGHAGRIFDRVRARFGADVVFMDVTAIDAGADFVEAIDKAVGTCDVLLAIIGPQWVSAADRAGHKRLDTPTDFVRLEIAGALKRNVRVVPVLVDDARLPAAADLPDDLQALLRRNAAELRDARWDADIEQLLASLDRIVTPRDQPLRLEAPPRGRMRALAAVAVAAVTIGAALVLGPRACAPVPESINVATTAPPAATTPPVATTPSATTPRASTPAAAEQPPAAATKVPVPDVAGRSLADARDVLRRAGVDVARVLYRDDRTNAVDTVVLQSDVRTSPGSPPAVALTAVARAGVVIRHRPEDGDLARGLLGALVSSKATAGLAIRTVETPVVRPEAVARVIYSDAALAATAADIAKDANAWLQQSEPGRPLLTASVYPPVVPRMIIIGLPEGGVTSLSSAALPDVRGLDYLEARRLLAGAGATSSAKWFDDEKRKPLEVIEQETLPGRVPGTSVVVLGVVARASIVIHYVESDRAVAARFERDLAPTLKLGILSRFQPVRAPEPALAGKLIHGSDMPGEAASIATFVSGWLTKELGRTVSIQPVADSKVSPRTLLLALPQF